MPDGKRISEVWHAAIAFVLVAVVDRPRVLSALLGVDVLDGPRRSRLGRLRGWQLLVVCLELGTGVFRRVAPREHQPRRLLPVRRAAL